MLASEGGRPPVFVPAPTSAERPEPLSGPTSASRRASPLHSTGLPSTRTARVMAKLAACRSRLLAEFEAAGTGTEEAYIFGYGSLIWKPEEHVEAHHCALGGFLRRWAQASPDHRGTPRLMGRVLTMLPADPAQAPQ